MRPGTSRHRQQGGFTLHETLWAAVVLSVALLGHAASAFSEQRMAQATQRRSEALDVTRRFVERLRADEDFSGLLARIQAYQVVAGAGAVALEDGRNGYPAATYSPGFLAPTTLGTFLVRVEVPLRGSEGAGYDLREDANEPSYDLPADLNGDGTIDDASHDLDYRALPVSLTFQWTAPGHAPATLRLWTWLRGDR
jgi:hypothetical protein